MFLTSWRISRLLTQGILTSWAKQAEPEFSQSGKKYLTLKSGNCTRQGCFISGFGHCRGIEAHKPFFRLAQEIAGLKSSLTFPWHLWALQSNTEKRWLKAWVSNSQAALLFIALLWLMPALCQRTGQGCHLENSQCHFHTHLRSPLLGRKGLPNLIQAVCVQQMQQGGVAYSAT